MKRILAFTLAVVCVISLFGCGEQSTEEKFYNKVVESKQLLDEMSELLKQCESDAMWQIVVEQSSDTMEKLSKNHNKIKKLFADLEDSNIKRAIVQVMNSYVSYYTAILSAYHSEEFDGFYPGKHEKDLGDRLTYLSKLL